MNLNMKAMEDTLPKEESRSSGSRPACTECQRRKQKCNREWPCNHCQKRKVADKCRFNTVLDERSLPAVDHRRQIVQPPAVVQFQSGCNERLVSHDGLDDDYYDGGDDYHQGYESEDMIDAGLEALGYSAANFLSLSGGRAEKKAKPSLRQYYRQQGDCSQLDHALQVLPPRPYTDALVQHFLNVVNFHFYIIHPRSFVKEYEQWWSDKFQNKALPLPWTSLLLMICACSAQFADAELQRKLEHDLSQPMRKLSERYHTAGRELYNTIPVGHSHLHTVQQLLHSCYWFKSEARYVECWHALTAGIREAQELGIHQESIVHVANEFEREMRRRVWCILSIWDWQIGSLLSRSPILDPTECDVQLPNLSLEDYIPSPVLALKLQAELIWTLSRRFGRPIGVTKPHEIEEYKGTVDSWASRIPQPYTIGGYDNRLDAVCPWIPLHRFYLHTCSCSMALDPLRPFLVRPISAGSTQFEVAMRRDGVEYALKLVPILLDFFAFLYPGDAKYHAVVFFIFDVAALLCSAILHDEDRSLPQREECLRAIRQSRSLLGQHQKEVASARKPYEMLNRLFKKLEKLHQTAPDNHNRKRAKMANAANMMAPSVAHHSIAAPPIYPVGIEMMQSRMPQQGTHPHEPWMVVPSGMDSISPYQGRDNLTFGPSPSNGISCISGSFILSTSPGGHLGTVAPQMTTGVYNNPENENSPTPDEQYQDFNFANITEDDLGTLANIWDYGNLNLDFVTHYP